MVAITDGGAWTERLVVTPIDPSKDPEPLPTGAGTPTSNGPADAATTAGSGAPPSAPLAMVLKKPVGLSFAQGAVAAFAYLPAYLLLHRVACVRDGDLVLVHSAGGGVVSLT